MVCKYFLPSVGCLFTLLIVSFAVQKFLSLVYFFLLSSVEHVVQILIHPSLFRDFSDLLVYVKSPQPHCEVSWDPVSLLLSRWHGWVLCFLWTSFDQIFTSSTRLQAPQWRVCLFLSVTIASPESYSVWGSQNRPSLNIC